MREHLLEILAEPGTGAALRLEAERAEKGRIETGRLVSEKTGRIYPIVAGIPRFAPPTTYTDSFGLQWNRFRRVQLDSSTSASYSERRFDDEVGWNRSELEGRWVLDAGCGAGRFAEIVARRGAKLVALDYSSAVDAAQRTLAAHDNVELVQGSLLEPPFRPGTFDFAYCIGVIQHTPDRERAIAGVLSCLRPGGRFSFSIYARRPWTKLNAKYLIRPLTKRLPHAWLLRAIEVAMPLVFPVTDRLFRLPMVGRVAQFTIPVATYLDRPEFTDAQRYDEAILDTFDMLSPQFDCPMTAEEVEQVFRREGAARWEFRARVPIYVGGTR